MICLYYQIQSIAHNIKMMSVFLTLCMSVMMLIISGNSQILPVDAQLTNIVFKHNEIVILYVDENKQHKQADSVLKVACKDGIVCASISSEHSEYEYFRSFIGYSSTPYLAIIDSQQQHKYVIRIQSNLTGQFVAQFKRSFDNDEIEPYYASEKIPTYNETSTCLRLVGKNYENFLALDPPIKIVYLYSSDKVCSSCPQLLVRFRRLAEKQHEQDLMIFGFLDVSLNDSPYIRDEIFPYFLIYFLDNFDDPYGVEADEFSQLDFYIAQMKKEYKRILSSQEQVEEREIQNTEQSDDINLDQF